MDRFGTAYGPRTGGTPRPVTGNALSGFRAHEDARKGRDADSYQHLTKPVKFQRLDELNPRGDHPHRCGAGSEPAGGLSVKKKGPGIPPTTARTIGTGVTSGILVQTLPPLIGRGR